jgi:hypothetical protein
MTLAGIGKGLLRHRWGGGDGAEAVGAGEGGEEAVGAVGCGLGVRSEFIGKAQAAAILR